MARTIKTVPEMTQELIAEREANGYTKKLYAPKGSYKEQVDTHKGEQLQADIAIKVDALKAAEQRGKVDWNNMEQVKQRTFEYLEACQAAEVYPSIMGLAAHGYGVSRQALNQYLNSHDNEATAFISMVKDTMADILTNASLYNNANPIAVIFQLKNHFEHADRVEIAPVVNNPLGEPVDRETIIKKYIDALPAIDEE